MPHRATVHAFADILPEKNAVVAIQSSGQELFIAIARE
jgi:hypothetical protein